MAAAREATTEQQRLLAAGASFGLETTFSGKRELFFMQAAKEAGYKISLVYVCVDKAQTSAWRVAQRVAAGGHSVPEADVLRRYPRSLDNLAQAIEKADRVYVLDNTGKRRRLVLTMEAGRVKYASRNLPQWAKRPLSKTLGRLT